MVDSNLDNRRNILLVDNSVIYFPTIMNSIDLNKSDVIVFDSNEHTYNDVLSMIREKNQTGYKSIGILQNNSNLTFYQFTTKEKKCLLSSVETDDSTLSSWNEYINFINSLKTEFSFINLDLLVCALYSDPNWKYVIDTLETQLQIQIRSSINNTNQDGYWFLDTQKGINLRSIYLVNQQSSLIQEIPPISTTKKLILIDNRIKDIETIINSMNDNTYCIVFNYFYDTYDTLLSKIRFLSGSNRYILDNFFYETPELPVRKDSEGNHCTTCDEFSIDDLVLSIATLESEYLAHTNDPTTSLWEFHNDSTNIAIQKPIFFQRSKKVEINSSVNYRQRPFVNITDLDAIYQLAQTSGQVTSTLTFECVGIVQHTVQPYLGYKLVNNIVSEPAIIQDIQTTDSNLLSWSSFASFIQSLKTVCQITTLDLMACALYANPDWKYIIDNLEIQQNITIRASNDNTGSPNYNGNWILETNNTNLTNVYFTDNINNWQYVLATYIDNRFYGLRFNDSMYATRAYDARLKIAAGTSNFTIETWYYETAARYNCTIVDMGDYNYTFQIRNVNVTNAVGLSLYNSGLGNWIYAESAVVPVAQWSHIAITRSGSTFTFYVNGIARQTFTNSGSLYSNNSTFAIGWQSPDTCQCNRMKTDCVLYDIRLWNVARTASEIQMNRNRIVLANSSGLVANYLCTDNSSTFNDRTSNALHNTIQNYDSARWTNSLVPIPNIGFLINNGYSLTSYNSTALNAVTHFDDITNTDFSNLNLSGVNFTNANLTGCKFISANLSNAVLNGANLTNADLTNATLDGTYLIGANLTGATTTGSTIASAITTTALTKSNSSAFYLTPPTGATTTYGPTWSQLGSTVYGANANDYLGFCVSISKDGNIIAVSSPGSDVAGTDRGFVKVFSWNGSSWVQRGGTFYGISNNDLITSSKLSSDGNYLVFSYNDTAVSNKGFTGVFIYDSNKTVEDTNVNSASYGPIGWSRVGGFIYNESTSNKSWDRNTICISGNGQIIAIGCDLNDGTSGSASDNRGNVRVYRYDPSKLSEVTDQANTNFGPVGWTRMGVDIDGESAGDNFGAMIELSTDGTVLAGAAINSDVNGTDNGQVRVFKWNSSSSTWVQRGRTIYGQLNVSWDTTYRFANTLSLSADGNVIACGSNSFASYAGITKTLKWNSFNNDYQIVGQQLKEYGDWQLSGHCVSLSSDGQILVIGAYDSDRGIAENGTLRVYKLTTYATTLVSSPPTNMMGYTRDDTTIYRMTITGNSSTGSVWGTNLYTADSNIARAAVHAGVIANGETKEVYIKMERFQYKYFGSTRNGVTTNDYTDSSMTYLSYYFMDTPKLWVQLGNEIAGQSVNMWIGFTCAVSGDGTRFITGGWANSNGLYQVYSLNSTDNYSHTSSINSIAEVYGDIVIPKKAGFTTIASKQSSTITTSLLAITGTAPTFTSFPSVSKFTNDPQFTLTLPESNSTGAFTLTTGTVGATVKYSRNALRFDGVNDTVILNSYPLLNTNQQTLEGWIFLTTYPCNIVTINANSGIDILADGRISNWLRSTNSGWLNIISTSTVPLNTWTYVAVVKNDNGYNKIYINNNIVFNTADTSSGNLTPCEGLSFGANAQGGVNYSSFILSEFRIWSIARTEKQIRDNYNREVLSNSTGLQVYYKFNQGTAGGNNAGLTTLTDATSNGYNGTLSNFALSGTSSNYVTGVTMLSKDKYNISNETPAIATINPDVSVNALNFNGTNNYIDLLSNITEMGQANFTIECWIKTTGSRMGILNCQDSDNPPVWESGEKSFYLDSSGKPAFVGFGNNFILSTQAVDDNNWHHVAVVWSYSTTTGYIYIDGKDRTNKLNNLLYQAVNNNTGRFIVGVPNNSESVNYFSGSMCELRIWSAARTASQIYQNFRRILNGDESGLVCYNRLNQGTANGSNSGLTTATNNMLSGGFSGTLSGFSLVSNTSNWVDGVTLRPNKDVTISGVGVATITAIQEEADTYDVGTTTATVTVALKIASSILTLDGDNDAVNVGIPAWTYSTQFRTTMTVECWFKTSDTNNQKVYTTLVSRNSTGGLSNFSQFSIYMLPTGEIGFGLTNNSNTGFAHTTILTYKDTQWHHVVGTYDSATGTKIIYIDGVAVKTDTSASFSLLSNNSTIKLIFGSDDYGVTNSSTDRQFRGSLSDVRIWSTVRTASEISNNYRQRLIGNETSLLGYWKLNQGNGTGWGSYTVAIDSTNNRANGTLTNFASPSSNWTLSTLAFLPRISDITLGSKNGLYSLSDSSFTFIDPLSNSFGNFSYAINNASIATISNGIATTKTVYTTSGAVSIPTLSLYDFPEIASLTDWEINVSFTVTNGNGTWRALIGDMYNELTSGRGWGIWISAATPQKIHWSFVGNTFEPTQTIVSLNTPYVLNVSKSSTGTITLTLQNVSGLHDTTLVSSISNLVGSYSFDSNANDSSGNSNNLTNVSSVTFNTSDYKRGLGAASFNGSNYFEIANDGRFSPDNFTVALWIKPVSHTIYQSIASCRASNPWRGWMLYIGPSSAGSNLEIWSSTNGNDFTNQTSVYNNFGGLNKWVHLAFTLNKSTSALIVYVNGIAVTTTTLGYTNNTGTNLRIGAGANEQGSLFNLVSGTLMDDFRFYNKVLSASEIASLVSSISNLVAAYNFDNNGIDSSPNNNTLTNVNTVTFNTSDYKRGSGAASFSGSNHFEIVNDGRFSPDNFTVAFWIKPVDSSGNVQSIASCRDGYSFRGWMIYIGPTNTLDFITGSGSGWSSPPYWGSDVLLNDIGTINTWVHIAFTLSKSTNTVVAYINGTAQATITRTYVNNTSYPLRIGSGGDYSYGELFLRNGTRVDDFRFYNKVLSASEIGTLVADSSFSSSFNIGANTIGKGPVTIGGWRSYGGEIFPGTISNINVKVPTNQRLVTLLANTSGTPATITATQDSLMDFDSGTKTASLTVGNTAPTLSNFTVAAQNFGSAPFSLTAPTSNSGGAFTYTSSNTAVATISGSTVTVVGAGSSTITATQAASGSYSSATTTATFTVNQIAPTISNLTVAAQNFGSSPFSLVNPTSNSGGSFTYTSSNTAVATISGSTVTIVSAGSSTITATQASTTNYTSGTITTSFTVNQIAPTISNFTVAAQNFGSAPFSLTAPTSNSGGAFTYTSSNTAVATISGSVVTIVSVGSSTITATQASTTNYTSSTIVATFTVNQTAPTLSNFTVAAQNFGSAPFSLVNPTSNSGGAFTYTSSNTAVATISGSTVTVVGAGSSTITATQASTTNYTSGTITATFTVNQIAPTLSNFSIATKYFGQPTFSLTAPTSNSGGSFTYSSSNTAVATISGTTVTILSVGTSTITATQASTTNYTQGTITATLTVNSYENANLTGFDLSNNNLTGLNLSNSILTNVTSGSIIGNPILPTNYILVNGYIIGPNVNLSNVNFTSQNLTNANFTGVNLTGANLTSATLTGVISGSITGTPTLSASYSMINGYIIGPSVNLSSKNLSNMNLLASNLTNVNLNNAILDNTDFSNTTLTGVISGGITGTPILPTNYSIVKGYIIGANVNLTGATLTNINYSKVLYSAFDDFISGPTAQSTSNDWQYFEINTDRSGASFLSNWQPEGTTNIPNYGQWDNNRDYSSFPFVQKVGDSGTIVSGYGPTFTGPALVMHPNNSDTFNCGLGYKNNTGGTINVNIDIALSLLFGTTYNLTGVNYFIQRGLLNDARYKLYVNSSIPEKSTDTFTFNKKNIELQNGEFIYLIINRNGNFEWDFTRVVFNITLNNFRNLSLTSVNFTNTNLSGTNLSNATLTNCNVNNTDFRTATLTGLISSDLTGTPLLPSNYFLTNGVIITNPSLSNFTVAARNFGSSAFTLTPPTSNSGGSFTYTSSNTSVATISGSTVTIVGVGSSTITATQAASGIYTSGTITATFTVNPIAPTLSNFTVAAKNFGDAAFSLTAPTSNSGGSFTYTSSNTGVATISGSTVTVVGAGSSTITATQASTTNYTSGTITATFVVNPIAPTISNFTVTAQNFGSSPFSLTAPTSNSGGAFTYTSSNTAVATISGSTVTVVGAGSSTITATQASTTNYISGTVVATFTVNPIAPTLSNFTIPAQNFGSSPFSLTAPTSNSDGSFSYTSSNTSVATISGSTVTVVGAGSSTITATQASTTNYTSGTVVATFTVNPIAPSLSNLTIATKNFGDSTFNIITNVHTSFYIRTGNSDWTNSIINNDTSNTNIQYWGPDLQWYDMNYDNPNRIASQFRFFAAYVTKYYNITSGSASVFTGGGNVGTYSFTYNGGTSYTGTFTGYNVGAQTWNYTLPVSVNVNTLVPTSNSGGSFTYTSSNTSVATISGTTITIVGAGSSTITATQASTTNYTSGTITATFTVNPIAPSLSNFTIPAKDFASAAFSLIAPTSNSSGSFTYTSSNTAVATISGSTITVINAGSSTITATQASTTNYISGTITTTFTVNPIAPSIVISSPIATDFSFTQNSFNQVGQSLTIQSLNVDGYFAPSIVKISEDGTKMAVGGIGGDNKGIVRMYSLTSGSWTQIGGDILGTNGGGYAGFGFAKGAGSNAISISSDGTLLTTVETGLSNPYQTRFINVFKYDASKTVAQNNSSLANYGPINWSRMTTISVTATYDYTAGAVISADGKTIAVSDGTLRMYHSEDNGVTWTQRGSSIVDPANGMRQNNQGFSNDVSISSNGLTVLAATNPMYSGGVNAQFLSYDWDGTNWNSSLVREFSWGVTISNAISSDASTCLVTISNNSYNNGNIYRYSRVGLGSWTLINNMSTPYWFYSVSISNNAKYLSLTRPQYNVSDFGDVEVYYWDGTTNNPIINNRNIKNRTLDIAYEFNASLSSNGSRLAVGGTGKIDVYDLNGTPNYIKIYNDPAFRITATSSNSTGTITYTSSNTNVANITDTNLITIGNVGSSTINANISATTNYTTSTTPALLTVNQATPSLSNFTVAAKNFGSATFSLTAPTSNSGGSFTYTSSNTSVATISGSTVTVVNAGSTTITATQASTSNYTSGTITTTFIVNQIAPTLSNFTVAAKDFASAAFNLVAPTSNSGGLFTYISSNTAVATISGSTVTIVGGGTSTITATQASTTNYTSANITTSFLVNPIAPTISNFSVATKKFGDLSFSFVAPTTNSAGSFSYTSSNTLVATTSGSTATLTGPGTTTITSTQAATANYTSGTITATFIVTPNQGIALSGDGLVFAMGKPNFNSQAGKVEIYSWNGTSWVQKGSTLNGSVGDSFGYSLSLSNTGNIVLIGAYSGQSSRGYAKAYEFISNDWQLKGLQINGDSNNDEFTRSVSLSSDGATFAGGSPASNYVKIFNWNGSAWTQKGLNLTGESSSRYGESIQLSSDGSLIAIGAPNFSTNTGYTKVFEFISSSWTQKGSTLNGAVINEYFGYSVSLSGTNLAVGAYGGSTNTGYLKYYKWINSSWQQKGGTVSGSATGNNFGYSVALSSNNKIVTGAYGLSNNTGQVKAYIYNPFPSNPTNGQVFYNIDDNNLYIYDESGWVYNNFTTDGSIVNSGTTTLNGAVTIGTTLNVLGNTTLTGMLNVSDNTTLTGNVGIGQAPSATYKLDVLGTARASLFTTTSDYRIKEDINDVTNEDIDELKPVKYKNKLNNKLEYGFIAHQVQDIFPEIVQGEKDGEEYQSINYLGLIPIMVHEIKQLKEEIRNLKRKRE